MFYDDDDDNNDDLTDHQMWGGRGSISEQKWERLCHSCDCSKSKTRIIFATILSKIVVANLHCQANPHCQVENWNNNAIIIIIIIIIIIKESLVTEDREDLETCIEHLTSRWLGGQQN